VPGHDLTLGTIRSTQMQADFVIAVQHLGSLWRVSSKHGTCAILSFTNHPAEGPELFSTISSRNCSANGGTSPGHRIETRPQSGPQTRFWMPNLLPGDRGLPVGVL